MPDKPNAAPVIPDRDTRIKVLQQFVTGCLEAEQAWADYEKHLYTAEGEVW